MKLAVTRCDGATEIIILNDPVQVFEGTGQARIHSAEGMDHYFRLSDGKYDGYGMGAPSGGWTNEQAKTYLQRANSERQIIPLSVRQILIERFSRFFRHHSIRIAYLNWQVNRAKGK